jgi:CheY-like chemotaxis protein
LIVDCDACVLNTVGAMLRLKGHAVDYAASPGEALRAVLGGLRAALMVAEFLLPGMDGVTLAERIRRSLPGLAVIIVGAGATDLPHRLTQRGRSREEPPQQIAATNYTFTPAFHNR